MDVAAFIIGLVALLLSTVSVTLQVIEKFPKNRPLIETPIDPFEAEYITEEELPPLNPPSRDALEAVEIQKNADINRLNDLFANPDITYTGIDDEFENF